jgi:hypothetical protein
MGSAIATDEGRSTKLARLCTLLEEAIKIGDAALPFTQFRQR